jgi:hypothetical protein
MRLRLMLPTAGVLTLLCGVQAFAAPIVVTCRPGERAIVRDGFVRGEAVTRVACARSGVYRPAVYRTPYEARRRATRTHRSWGKSALIIGGSAGTGAGIGGIVHGKKGALIGAALGGGIASLYEGAHRR